jgi:hypothetical protein
MVVLVSAVVAALGLAVAGPATERWLLPHPAGARTNPRWDPPARAAG